MILALASPPPVLGSAIDPADAAVALGEARTWLARELHDGVVQRLTTMVVELELLKRQTGPVVELDGVLQSARAAVCDLRGVLCDLRQEPTIQTGFVESIRGLLTELMSRSGITADLAVQSCPSRLRSDASSQLQAVIGEALNNVRRHSGAAHVTVTVQVVDDALAITVADDGRGMRATPGGATPGGATPGGGGFGIRGMRERVLILGGRLIHDGDSGHGTTVRCIVPLARLV